MLTGQGHVDSASNKEKKVRNYEQNLYQMWFEID
jgi:hypothetical protein